MKILRKIAGGLILLAAFLFILSLFSMSGDVAEVLIPFVVITVMAGLAFIAILAVISLIQGARNRTLNIAIPTNRLRKYRVIAVLFLLFAVIDFFAGLLVPALASLVIALVLGYRLFVSTKAKTPLANPAMSEGADTARVPGAMDQ